jgi:hypothetical protein
MIKQILLNNNGYDSLITLEGKTISKTFCLNDEITILFTDNTYIVIKAINDWDNVPELIIEQKQTKLEKAFTKFNFKIINTIEFEKIQKGLEIKQKKELEKQEKELLIKLKRKYEKK